MIKEQGSHLTTLCDNPKPTQFLIDVNLLKINSKLFEFTDKVCL